MAMMPKCFRFHDDVAAYRDARAHIVRIPARILDKPRLMRLLARELKLPAYFGANWDALDESLRDLSSLPETKKIALVHDDVPFSARGTLRGTYLDIVRSAAESWKPGDPHELIAVFPKACAAEVAAALARD